MSLSAFSGKNTGHMSKMSNVAVLEDRYFIFELELLKFTDWHVLAFIYFFSVRKFHSEQKSPAPLEWPIEDMKTVKRGGGREEREIAAQKKVSFSNFHANLLR